MKCQRYKFKETHLLGRERRQRRPQAIVHHRVCDDTNVARRARLGRIVERPRAERAHRMAAIYEDGGISPTATGGLKYLQANHALNVGPAALAEEPRLDSLACCRLRILVLGVRFVDDRCLLNVIEEAAIEKLKDEDRIARVHRKGQHIAARF